MNKRGVTLLEVVITMPIVAILALSLYGFYAYAFNKTKENREKAFALEKAEQILEEIKSLSLTNLSNQNILDPLQDTIYNPLLTIDTTVSSPGNPLSGNISIGTGIWKYVRWIDIDTLSASYPTIRLATVKLYKADPDNYPYPKNSTKPLAQLSKILMTGAVVYPPSQVFDIYFLAVTEVPGWWTYVPQARATAQIILNALKRNPGLEFREHYIFRLAFGRDPYYAPQFNDSIESSGDWSHPMVYIYPSLIDSANNLRYYSSQDEEGNFHLNVQPAVTSNEYFPYSIADQYNHAVRYPEEIKLYQEMLDSIPDSLSGTIEPSWMYLIQDMYDNPDKYKNAMIVNLHGEAFPVPPVRNYSDPAKDPEDYPYKRAVTHPESLRIGNNDHLYLRVYTFTTDPSRFDYNDVIDTVSVFIPVNWAVSQWWPPGSGTNRIYVMRGDSSSGNYNWASATLADAYGNSYTLEGQTGTILYLFNSKIRHGYNSDSLKGLPASKRLYGLEYIPSLVAGSNFNPANSRDLDDTGNLPKNTARWRIKLHKNFLPNDSLLTIYTWIGGPNNYKDPLTNVSKTYVWVGTEPPEIEKYQILGDPRHMPYQDVKHQDRYNWFFTDSATLANEGYEGFDRATGPYIGGVAKPGSTDVDIPAIYKIIRESLIESEVLFAHITGQFNILFSLGQEIGATPDIDPFYDNPNFGIPITQRPWDPSAATVKGIDEITSSYIPPNIKYLRIPAEFSGNWISVPWIGEIFHDSVFTYSWRDYGNLPDRDLSGLGLGFPPGHPIYYRAKYSDVLPSGVNYERTRELGASGTRSFFNAVGSNGSDIFYHTNDTTFTSVATQAGSLMIERTGIPVPYRRATDWPFKIGDSAIVVLGDTIPPEWYTPPYDQKDTIVYGPIYYEGLSNPTLLGTAFLKLKGIGGQTGKEAYFLICSYRRSYQQSHIWSAAHSLPALIQGYMDLGDPDSTPHVHQLPRVVISSPFPGEIISGNVTLSWSIEWKRWDGDTYSDFYTPQAESDNIIYAVKYTPVDTTLWLYLNSPSDTTEPGERPPPGLTVTSPYTTTISSPGNYILRVEAFRNDYETHYSYHQVKIRIQ